MAKKRNKKRKPKIKTGPLKGAILQLLKDHRQQAFSVKRVIKKLGIRDRTSKLVAKEVLIELARKGKVLRLSNGSFAFAGASPSAQSYEGTVDYVSSRFAYIICEDLEDDIWVRTEDMHNALHGDKVKVVLRQAARHGRRPEGEVLEVLERSRTDFVGKMEISGRHAFVIADNKRMHLDIFVLPGQLGKAKHGDKVIVSIVEWPERGKKPAGKIIDVLGKAGENDAEIHSIMAEFELPFKFSASVSNAAKKIEAEITDVEVKKRKDLRKITTFTIDPVDAKDFDDALSLRLLENGNYEVGIHIADVTHYVKPDTLLDKEAFHRATSVYLVDRTIPMLPERLSNDLCSLRPREDKLTFSAIFEMDANAHVKNEWFGRTIIHSDRRFSYEEAQERIESVQGDFSKELTLLNELALKLRVNRFMRGAINFETTEVRFKLDENGKPLGVVPKVRKDAHKLVEEFMLLANRKVATFIYEMKKGKDTNTFVYRSHDYPNPDKLTAFSVFAKKFGHKLNIEEQAIAKSINNLIEDIEGKPEQDVLQNLAIRTMAKALYTTEPKGHFGLAFRHYSHFTSPIRRYPDVMVHRLLQHYLSEGKSVDKEEYETKCEHSSEREKRAAEAERASIKYKQVEYIESVKDQIFEGIVSGVTEWGIFVELIETKCEGMVRMADLDDDYYEFDEENFRVVGKHNKKMITLGDPVKVAVKQTDIDRRTIDLLFV
ncbi:MAG: ribonuclease R [Cyclobacteriaceae bacterium]